MKLVAERFFRYFQPSETQTLIILSVLVGLVTGLGAIGFILMIEYFNGLFFGLTDQILTQTLGMAEFRGYTACQRS